MPASGPVYLLSQQILDSIAQHSAPLRSAMLADKCLRGHVHGFGNFPGCSHETMRALFIIKSRSKT